MTSGKIQSPRPSRIRRFLVANAIPIGLVLASVAVYANSVTNDFVLDDVPIIKQNPQVRGLDKIPALFAMDYWAPSRRSGLYRPMVMTTYVLQHELFGPGPLSFHVVNILLHAAVSVLAWMVFRRVVENDLVAGGASFLFAVLAIHSEVVANTVGRAELMWSLLVLVAFLGYQKLDSARPPRARWLYAGCLAAYLVALLTKESAVTLLGIIGVHDLLRSDESIGRVWRRVLHVLAERWRVYSGFVLTTALYMMIRGLGLGWGRLPPPIHIDNPMVTSEPLWNFITALEVSFRYLALQIFPLHLSYDYSYAQIPMITSLGEPRAIVALVLTAATVALTVWSFRRSHSLFFAIMFYLATFSPVSNLIIVIGTIMGERLVYAPSMGFCLGLAIGVWALCSRALAPVAARRAFIGVFLVLISFNALRTVIRNPNWADAGALFPHDQRVSSRSSKAMNNAAAIAFGNKEYDRAIELFEEAVAISPSYHQPYRTAGFLYTEIGEDEKAMEMYNLTIRYGARDPKVFNNMGFLLVDHEIDLERGIKLLERAVSKRPKQYEYLDSLGWGYYRVGRLEEAREKLELSLELNSDSESTEDRRAHLEAIKAALADRGVDVESEPGPPLPSEAPSEDGDEKEPAEQAHESGAPDSGEPESQPSP